MNPDKINIGAENFVASTEDLELIRKLNLRFPAGDSLVVNKLNDLAQSSSGALVELSGRLAVMGFDLHRIGVSKDQATQQTVISIIDRIYNAKPNVDGSPSEEMKNIKKDLETLLD